MTSATSGHTSSGAAVRERPERAGTPSIGRRPPARSHHQVPRAGGRPARGAGRSTATAATGWRPGARSAEADSALAHSRGLLADARREGQAADRFRLAHLAALRAAAALLSVHADPGYGRRRPQSAWTLIDNQVPRFSEWAAYFAAGARTRAAAEAGLRDAVTPTRAAELLDAVELFLFLVAAEVRADGPIEQAVIPPPAVPPPSRVPAAATR